MREFNGTRFATISEDHSEHLWDFNQHEPIGKTLTGLTNPTSAIPFSPDGKNVVTYSKLDNKFILWEIETGKRIGEPITVPSGERMNIVFSPDGRKILYSLENRGIHVFDIETHNWVGTPIEGEITSNNIFSPDRRFYIPFKKTPDRVLIRLIEFNTGRVFLEMPMPDKVNFYNGFVDNPDQMRVPLYCSFDSDKILIYLDPDYPYVYDWRHLQEVMDEQRERFKDRKLTPEERKKYYLE